MTHDPDGSAPAGGTTSLMRAFLLCLALIAIFIVGDLAFFANGASFKREGGGLETVSAVLYGVAAIVFFINAPAREWARLFHVPALMVLFAMRELDMDKAFTPSGVLSLRLYSGDAPLMTKLIAGAVAVFAVFVILRNVWFGTRGGWQALRAGQLWPWFALLAGALVVATKSVDGLGRKMLDFGIVISQDLDATASLAEEVGEVFIPVCAILAMLACWKRTPR
ncbi:MAG: hypothetical protein WBV62_13905 [Roseobacter sp.]